MFAKLSALVAGGPALNYTIDPTPYGVAWGGWTHFPGTSKDDGSAVSVFRIAAGDPADPKLVAARNGAKRLRMVRVLMYPPKLVGGVLCVWFAPIALIVVATLRWRSSPWDAHTDARCLPPARPSSTPPPPNPPTHPKPPASLLLASAQLRHPNILAFKDSVEVQEKGQHVLYVVTEAVRPLSTVLAELALSGQHRDEYLATGVLHMANAVSFLNNSCNMVRACGCGWCGRRRPAQRTAWARAELRRACVQHACWLALPPTPRPSFLPLLPRLLARTHHTRTAHITRTSHITLTSHIMRTSHITNHTRSMATCAWRLWW